VWCFVKKINKGEIISQGLLAICEGHTPVFAKSVPFQFLGGFPGIASGIILWQYATFLVALTTINKGILVNDINFSIEINIINHFFNNRAQTLNDYNLKMEKVQQFFVTDGAPTMEDL